MRVPVGLLVQAQHPRADASLVRAEPIPLVPLCRGQARRGRVAELARPEIHGTPPGAGPSARERPNGPTAFTVGVAPQNDDHALIDASRPRLFPAPLSRMTLRPAPVLFGKAEKPAFA